MLPCRMSVSLPQLWRLARLGASSRRWQASCLAIVMGSKNFIIGNILIRSLMALFLLAFAARWMIGKRALSSRASRKRSCSCCLWSMILIIREFGVVGVTLLMQLLQGVVCAVLGAVLLRYMPLMQPDKMLEIRRPVD